MSMYKVEYTATCTGGLRNYIEGVAHVLTHNQGQSASETIQNQLAQFTTNGSPVFGKCEVTVKTIRLHPDLVDEIESMSHFYD